MSSRTVCQGIAEGMLTQPLLCTVGVCYVGAYSAEDKSSTHPKPPTPCSVGVCPTGTYSVAPTPCSLNNLHHFMQHPMWCGL